MRRRSAAWAAALALILSGCAAGAEPVEVDPTPVRVGDDAPPAEAVSPTSLPQPFASFRVVAPGWDETPEERDGLLLGIDSASAPAGPLRFVAAASDGTVLWEAERPPTCTGFALSRVGERPVAVLTDHAPAEDGVGRTTASAYDLVTGERLWGPVGVPGPHQGPGLVFASAPDAPEGRDGGRVALDPATGAATHDRSDVTVVGEYDGVVLTADEERVTARATGGPTLWSLPLVEVQLPAGSRPAAVPGSRPPQGTALVGASGADFGTLVDVADGTVLASGVEDARRDAASGTMVTLADDIVTGRGADGVAWSRHLEGDVRLAGVGGVLAYLRVDDAVHVLNAVTGKDATAYAPGPAEPVAVPALFSADGAAVVRLDEHLLVTTQPAPR